MGSVEPRPRGVAKTLHIRFWSLPRRASSALPGHPSSVPSARLSVVSLNVQVNGLKIWLYSVVNRKE